jgi:hypothetical protein
MPREITVIQTVKPCRLKSAAAAIRHLPRGEGFLPEVLALIVLTLALLFGNAARASAHEIADFVGFYIGSAEVEHGGEARDLRDLSVVIEETSKGLTVQWSTVSEKEDGRRKEKSYTVEFIASDRNGIYSAAMHRNVFGHEVQQDPMKGEPYVWARLTGDVLTVFSMFIHRNGDYEMQQYDRRLTETGLSLVFSSHRNGLPLRQIKADLLRQ